METIFIDVNVAEIIDAAGIETEANVLIDLVVELPIRVSGKYIPAKTWGDDAHPAEYPDAECMKCSRDMAVDLYRRSGLKLSNDEAAMFLHAAWKRMEQEIDKACIEALA